MSVLPFRSEIRDWTPRELKVFSALYNFRIMYGRDCTFLIGRAENGSPHFTLMVKGTGEIIMHIHRGGNGIGYNIVGPTRRDTYVETIEDLKHGYAVPNDQFAVKIHAKQN